MRMLCAPRSSRFLFSFIVSSLAACGGASSPEEAGPSPLEVASSLLSDAEVGAPYAAELIARGGAPPYAWTQLGPEVPGLELSASGRIEGTPTQAGSFVFEARVEDGTGQVARRDLSLRVAPGPIPRMALDGTCDMPTALTLGGGSQSFFAVLPSAAGGPSLCGAGAAQASAVFELTLSAPSRIGAAVTGEGRPSLALLAGASCAGSPTCGQVLSESVPAGTYRLVVSGDAGAEIGVTVEISEPSMPPGPGTCEAPEVLELASGRAVVMGTFEDAEHGETGSCSRGASPEVVYAVDLDAPADLRIASGTGLVYVRGGACASGMELACDDFSGVYLPNLEAGRYFVIVESRFSVDEDFMLDIRREAPTPPAPNATCATAIAPTFTNGAAELSFSFQNVPVSAFPTQCGSRERGLYYRVRLDAPGALEASQTSSNFSVELISGGCAGGTSLACTSFEGLCTPTLPAGEYILRVSSRSPGQGAGRLRLARVPARMAPANATCASAQSLGAGAMTSVNLADASDDVRFANCSPAGAGEVFFGLSLAARSDVVANLSGAGRSDTNVVVARGGCAQPEVLACAQGPLDPVPLYGVEPGPLLVVLEERRAARPGDAYTCRRRSRTVDLAVSVQPSPSPPPNDTCATTSSISFPRGLNSIETVQGTTRGAASDFASVSCGGFMRPAPAGDVVWAVDVPVAGRLRVEKTPRSFDDVLSLHTGVCRGAAATACSVSSSRPLETQSLAPGRYWLRVDGGARTTPQDFSLTLTLLP